MCSTKKRQGFQEQGNRREKTLKDKYSHPSNYFWFQFASNKILSGLESA